jgi:diguanylate cyclase (GGDEF)-like protein
MKSSAVNLQFDPDAKHRRSFLSLRWIVVIFASYLTLFSSLDADYFSAVAGFALALVASNLVIELLPASRFSEPTVQRVIAAVDFVFVFTTFYLLRIPDTYLHFAFALIFLLSVIWHELKLVLFSLFSVSLLFGAFSYFKLLNFEIGRDLEQFLTLALFFIVSIFYIFLSKRLKIDAELSAAMLEEKLNAEAMVEITSVLSSSLKTSEILEAIVNRVCDVLRANECWIVRVDPSTTSGEILAKAAHSGFQNIEIIIDEYPELKQAYVSRSLVFSMQDPSDAAGPGAIVAVPMVVQDAVIGLIYVQTSRTATLSDAKRRLFNVMASTAANALRNAQLFEEVEHRARTDFLTALPNHRHFQTTLALELKRAKRHNHSLSLLMIDLDFLKQVNDRFGHPSGDLVIRTIAETIRMTCREIDFPARYGGEEFTVILTETELIGAVNVAERIRERISEVSFPGIGHVTASIGISNYPANSIDKEGLIRTADQALYVAKNSGRDRVAYFNHQLVT